MASGSPKALDSLPRNLSMSLGTDQASGPLSSLMALVQGDWLSLLCSKQVHEVDWKNPGEGKGRSGKALCHRVFASQRPAGSTPLL